MDTEAKEELRVGNNCYDFPLAVIHTPICPRYRGGVCHPLPTPVEPMTDEERGATDLYNMLVAKSSDPDQLHPEELIPQLDGAQPVEATGITGTIRKVVH